MDERERPRARIGEALRADLATARGDGDPRGGERDPRGEDPEAAPRGVASLGGDRAIAGLGQRVVERVGLDPRLGSACRSRVTRGAAAAQLSAALAGAISQSRREA